MMNAHALTASLAPVPCGLGLRWLRFPVRVACTDRPRPYVRLPTPSSNLRCRAWQRGTLMTQ
jgi:hypothetical protein